MQTQTEREGGRNKWRERGGGVEEGERRRRHRKEVSDERESLKCSLHYARCNILDTKTGVRFSPIIKFMCWFESGQWPACCSPHLGCFVSAGFSFFPVCSFGLCSSKLNLSPSSQKARQRQTVGNIILASTRINSQRNFTDTHNWTLNWSRIQNEGSLAYFALADWGDVVTWAPVCVCLCPLGGNHGIGEERSREESGEERRWGEKKNREGKRGEEEWSWEELSALCS